MKIFMPSHYNIFNLCTWQINSFLLYDHVKLFYTVNTCSLRYNFHNKKKWKRKYQIDSKILVWCDGGTALAKVVPGGLRSILLEKGLYGRCFTHASLKQSKIVR
jgi:hypothetical protein